MPTTNSLELTLNRNGANVEIVVKYNVRFSAFEQRLSALGLRFRERIAVIGVDPAGATTGTVLKQFPSQIITVITDGTPQPVRHRIMSATRVELDEDPSTFLGPDFNPDEIRCRILIEAIGLPPAVTADAFTNQQVLGGEVISQPSAAA